MLKRAFAFAALLALSPALADSPSADPSLAPAGKYVIDPAHTRIMWRLSHMGYSFYNGWFAKFDASLSFDPNTPEKSSLEATIDTKSVFTLDPKFNEEIASEKFLDAGKTDPITFKATGLTRTGKNTGTMTGDMTLHGVTKPVTFNVTLIGGSMSQMKNTYVMGFEATATIKRSDYGITTYLDFGLGDEVQITVDCEFDNKPS